MNVKQVRLHFCWSAQPGWITRHGGALPPGGVPPHFGCAWLRPEDCPEGNGGWAVAALVRPAGHPAGKHAKQSLAGDVADRPGVVTTRGIVAEY
jgi:hypothetical protein